MQMRDTFVNMIPGIIDPINKILEENIEKHEELGLAVRANYQRVASSFSLVNEKFDNSKTTTDKELINMKESSDKNR